ncbi:hypothetical protein HAX54_050255 [Datura stramonium]|uniref:Uncharacterized protein n=1 Tax=Datura stramonium TaxID=4076 RepID=A0ABS8WN90_DATST|nr:hypothetical protein [Datura stramonium]
MVGDDDEKWQYSRSTSDKGIEDNWAAALEYNSEVFGEVMLYVDMEVHGHPLKVGIFIDLDVFHLVVDGNKLLQCMINLKDNVLRVGGGEEDISSNFLDQDRYDKEASSSRTQGPEFEVKVAKLVELGFGRKVVILALKFFDGSGMQGELFGCVVGWVDVIY